MATEIQRGLPGVAPDLTFDDWRVVTGQPGAICVHEYPMGACGYCDSEKRMGLDPITREEGAALADDLPSDYAPPACRFCGERAARIDEDWLFACADVDACDERCLADGGMSPNGDAMGRRRGLG